MMNPKLSSFLACSLLFLGLGIPQDSAKAQMAQGVPDLAVQTISFESRSRPVMPSDASIVEPGQSVHIATFQISNIGTAPSQNFRATLYIDGRRSNSLVLAGLLPGQTTHQSLYIPRIRPGTHTLAVTVERVPRTTSVTSARASAASGLPGAITVIPAIPEQRPGWVDASPVDTTICTVANPIPISSGSRRAVPVNPGTPSPCPALTYQDANPGNNTSSIRINISGSL